MSIENIALDAVETALLSHHKRGHRSEKYILEYITVVDTFHVKQMRTSAQHMMTANAREGYRYEHVVPGIDVSKCSAAKKMVKEQALHIVFDNVHSRSRFRSPFS